MTKWNLYRQKNYYRRKKKEVYNWIWITNDNDTIWEVGLVVPINLTGDWANTYGERSKLKGWTGRLLLMHTYTYGYIFYGNTEGQVGFLDKNLEIKIYCLWT